MTNTGTDFIVSELLSELKSENTRKDNQIKSLYKVLAIAVSTALVVVLAVVGAFLLYLNQYDFTSTTTEVVTNTAEGVYAIVDSEGNVIGSDYTAEDIQTFLKGVNDSGTSNDN